MSAQPQILTTASAAQLHEQLAGAVQALTQHSEGEVLEIGTRIGHMVEIAEAHAEALEQLRGAMRLEQLDAISAGQQSRVTAALEHILACIREQLTLVTGLADIAAHVSETYTALRRGIQSARLLGVYVRVEGANLSSGQVAIKSLAFKLSALSERMENASNDVRLLLQVLQEALPALQKRLREGISHCEELRRQMAAHGRAISKATVALSSELEQRFSDCMNQVQLAISASHRALSALQFQDPMIQSMQRLDPLAAEARQASGDPEAGPFYYGAGFASDAAHALDTEPAPPAGEAILF